MGEIHHASAGGDFIRLVAIGESPVAQLAVVIVAHGPKGSILIDVQRMISIPEHLKETEGKQGEAYTQSSRWRKSD
jgi:hypothetical protein